jgi:K(+)-stimulated pyrophosphate-energized sodium pump
MNELTLTEQLMLKVVVGVSLTALVYAYWLWKNTIGNDKGSQKMQTIWLAIKRGAQGYLQKQLKTIIFVLLSLTVILFLSVYVVPPSAEAVARFGAGAVFIIALGRTIAFIIGASFSTLVGQLGMRVAIEGNIRVTEQL